MHLQKLPSGKWRAQVKVEGEQRWTRAVPTRGEAQRLGADLYLRLGGGARPDNDVTVAEMLAAHLTEEADRWSPGYHHDIELVAKLERDTAGFTRRRLPQVTTSVLLALYRDLAANGWTRHRVKRIHTVLGTAFKMAIGYEWATSNPCTVVTPPTPLAAEVRPAADDEVAEILAALSGLDLLAVRLNATLGIRRGDVVGIEWDHVDLKRAEVRIWQSRRAGCSPTTPARHRGDQTASPACSAASPTAPGSPSSRSAIASGRRRWSSTASHSVSMGAR